MAALNSSFSTVTTTASVSTLNDVVPSPSAAPSVACSNSVLAADLSTELPKVSTTQTRPRPSSMDFAEQIRQLEMEGNRLRAATVNTLAQLGSPIKGLDTSSVRTADCSFEEVKPVTPPSLGSLASLIDISAEQKTIANLRAQLDAQRRETERLQSHLMADYPSSRSEFATASCASSASSRGFSIGGSPAKYSTGFSSMPTVASASDALAPRRTFEYMPPSHLERSLKESQDTVTDLKRRLQEATEMGELQRRQFRTNVEELKTKLHETIVNRDSVLELRQKEAASQENIICKLQASVQRLSDQCETLEKSLMEANKKVEVMAQTGSVKDSLLGQLKTLMLERENKRGRPYFEAEPVASQTPSMLVHTLERCLKEIEHDRDGHRSKAAELESELQETKREMADKEATMSRQHKERISQLTADYEKQVEAATERANNARQQSASLQSQLQVLESQHQAQLQLKEGIIQDLEAKVRQLKQEYNDDHTKWQERREALERSLDDVQMELVRVRGDRDEAIRSQAALETRVEDCQAMTRRLEGELETEREKSSQQREREEQLRGKVMSLENQLSNSQQDVARLEKMLDVVKQECSSQMQDRVSTAERLERDRNADQIRSLTAQVASLTEKFNKVTVELELSKSENGSLRQQNRELTDKLETLRTQMDATNSEKRHLSTLLGDRKSDVDRVAQERQHYFTLVEQKSTEITELRSTRERLMAQLEERERSLESLQQHCKSLSRMVELNSQTSESLREEREQLMAAMAEKNSGLEEARSTLEALGRKLQGQETRVEELETECDRLTTTLTARAQEVECLQGEKDNLFQELRQSRFEVANISDSKENYKKELAKQKAAYEKEISKLVAKLKGAEQDMKLAQKTLKTKDSVDHKAVRYADKMQKEVTAKRGEIDALQTKVRKLTEKLESLAKEKGYIERDKNSLKGSLAKSLLHTQHLNQQLGAVQAQNSELQDKLAGLTEQLEKATLKSSTSQAQIEQFEQEIARLKIKHQLDLKEVAQTAHSKRTKSGGAITTGAPSAAPLTHYPDPRPHDGGELRTEDLVSQPSDHTPTTTTTSTAATPVPLTTATERPTDSRSSDSAKVAEQGYQEVGSELRNLLQDIRSLLSSQKQQPVSSHSVPVRHSSPRRTRTTRTRAFEPPDTDTLSDSELEPSYSRPQSNIEELSAIPPYHEVSGVSGASRHRRSRSMDLSLTQGSASTSLSHLMKSADNSRLASSWRGSRLSRHESSLVSSKYSHLLTPPRKPLTPPRTRRPLVVPHSSVPPSVHLAHSQPPLLPARPPSSSSFLSEEEGAGWQPRAPDTQELCRRLEEKIVSLTKMGGSLQRENKEMADLMTDQGRKLQALRESERRLRKTPQ